MNLVLLSRRNIKNLGPRFLKRGIMNSSCANELETEQILYLKDEKDLNNVSSFLFVRGSIPFVWS